MTDNKCRPVSLKRQPHLTGRSLKPTTHGPRAGQTAFSWYRAGQA